jgi:hypothetical protein
MLTKKEILKQLKILNHKLNRPVKVEDINSDPFICSYGTIRKKFGGIKEARKAAGIPQTRGKLGYRKYKRKELIKKLKKLARIKGYTPTVYEVTKSDITPPSSTYSRYFPSYSKACSLAGLRPNIKGEKASVKTNSLVCSI